MEITNTGGFCPDLRVGKREREGEGKKDRERETERNKRERERIFPLSPVVISENWISKK